MGFNTADEAGPRTDDSHQSCYGVLESVFPMTAGGLREVPVDCLACAYRKPCLQTALQSRPGLRMRMERLEQASGGGWKGWLRRWSEKKSLSRRMKQERIARGRR